VLQIRGRYRGGRFRGFRSLRVDVVQLTTKEAMKFSVDSFFPSRPGVCFATQ